MTGGVIAAAFPLRRGGLADTFHTVAGQTRIMASLDLDRLWKIWMLAISASEGESIAACARAEAMVRPAGYALVDIPNLLARYRLRSADMDIASVVPRELARRAQRLAAEARAEAERAAERQRAERAAAQQARPEPPRPSPQPSARAEPTRPPPPKDGLSAQEQAWRDRHYPEIEAIIKRYGSTAKVFEKTEHEQALFNAVLPWHETVPDRETPGTFNERWDGQSAFREPTPAVRAALENAMPLPDTINTAIVEVRRWIRLNHDRSLVARYRDRRAPEWDFITGPVHMRASIVRAMAARTLAAKGLDEIIARVRFQLEHDMQGAQEAEAVLMDLQALQAHGTPARGSAPKQTKAARQDRRLAVARILATPEAASLSNREIAEKTGASAATVSAVRRELAQGPLLV